MHSNLAALYNGDDFPLLAAAEKGDLTLVKELVNEKKTDINRRLPQGWSPLILSCKEGHTEVASYLIAAGANVDPPDISHTPIRAAALYGHVDCIRLLIQSGADVNFKSTGNKDALMGAAMGGHTACVALLLEAGADTSSLNDFGETALDLASTNGFIDCVEAIKAEIEKKK
jgi:ankyrin repeat protein